MLNNSAPKRLELIDTIRGITLISMILYHFVWDMVHLYGAEWTWFYGAKIWQQSICWTFIILSGFSFSLSRHNLKRGLTVFGSGLLITAVTLIFTPKTRIVFGVLTLIGSSMLITTAIRKILNKIPSGLGSFLSFAVFLLTKNCYKGYLLPGIKLPKILYRNYITAFLGFPENSFYSSDYFPVIPWFFLFMFGYFIYRLLEEKGLNQKLFAKGKIPVVNFLGKHSLLIYLIHQPIIYGICEILFKGK